MKLIGVTALILLVVAVSAGPAEDLNAATRTFTAKLYTELIKTRHNQNIIFSPLSVQTLLALFSSASRDENRPIIQEIRNAVNLPGGEYNRQAGFRQILAGLTKSDNDFKVFDATKMYFKSGYSVEQWYQRIAQVIYRAEVETVNFGDKWGTSQKINQWVSSKTNNKIPNFVDYYDISPLTENLMLNTLYVMGKWDVPFEPQNNTIQNFNGPNGARQVTMLTAEHSYYYYEDNDAQYLKLEMLRDGGGADMIFVLPKRDLSQLEYNVYNLLKTINFELYNVRVKLPKFSIRSDMNLKPVLYNLGVKIAFDSGTILEGLWYPGHAWTKITDILQKAFIEVNEWGVTAAAITKESLDVDDPLLDTKTFTADHPFLYYITVDNAVVFAGRVVQV